MGEYLGRRPLLLLQPKSGILSPQGPNPPDQNTSTVTLPPEILDLILEHIPTNRDERRTLAACALVATWRAGPNRRRLFSSVVIHARNCQRLMNDVVFGSKHHLLGSVRSLWHYPKGGTKHPMRDLARDSGEYLPALRNIQHQGRTRERRRVSYLFLGIP